MTYVAKAAWLQRQVFLGKVGDQLNVEERARATFARRPTTDRWKSRRPREIP